jgi:hypothetical protein
MTSTIAQPTAQRPDTTAVRSAAGRFTAALASFGTIVVASVAASRSMESARTAQDRRAVLDRFVADTSPAADRAAA